MRFRARQVADPLAQQNFEQAEGLLAGTDSRLTTLEGLVTGLQAGAWKASPVVAGPTYGGNGTIYETVTMATHGDPVLCIGQGRVQHNGVAGTTYTLLTGIYLDGVAAITGFGWTMNNAGWWSPAPEIGILTPPAGTHTFTRRIVAVTATPAIGLYNHSLIVLELPLSPG